MKKLYFGLTIFIVTNCFSQPNRKLSVFLSFQANKTLFDRTITNNNGGIGFGLQTNLNTKTRVKPTLELNADFFAGTKELYLTSDFKPIEAKSGVSGIYIGPLFEPVKRLFIAATFGTSIYNNKAHFGIRPSVGLYPSKRKNCTAKVSFTNIFQRDDINNKSFGYFSFTLALKLF